MAGTESSSAGRKGLGCGVGKCCTTTCLFLFISTIAIIVAATIINTAMAVAMYRLLLGLELALSAIALVVAAGVGDLLFAAEPDDSVDGKGLDVSPV